MNYQEFFDDFKAKYERKNVSRVKEHFAFQYTITDEDCGGIFYVEIANGKLKIEPFDYEEHDASFECSAAVLTDIFSNKLSLCNAFKKEMLHVQGDMGKVVRFKTLTERWKDKPVRKPAKKTAKKSTAKKSAAKKPAATKTAATKPAATKSAASKPAATKPAATKPAAKKPAAKKPVAKKPAAPKSAK